MNECTKMHGFREKKLFSKNTKRSTLQPLFPFVNRGTAVWRGERGAGRGAGDVKKGKHPSH